jgi:hypothetical protein
LYEVENHPLAYILRHVAEIAFIARRKDNLSESCPISRENLFLDASDLENLAP